MTEKVATPEDIRAIPVIDTTPNPRTGSAFLVTSSPHKKKIEEAAAKKAADEEKQSHGAKRKIVVDKATGARSEKPPKGRILRKVIRRLVQSVEGFPNLELCSQV